MGKQVSSSSATLPELAELTGQLVRGEVSIEQAFYNLANQLGEVQSELEPLKHEESRIRELLGAVVGYSGTQMSIPGRITAVISKSSTRRSVSVDAVQELMRELIADGKTEMADRVGRLINETPVDGTLRINWTKR